MVTAPADYSPAVSYLQFFFNLSLILIFLYLAVQFILTVQKDVEKRISEYTQGQLLLQDSPSQ
jgi:Di-sulfide bridge nucleocytoplasmic transport domain